MKNDEMSVILQYHLGVERRFALKHNIMFNSTYCANTDLNNHPFGACKKLVVPRHNDMCEEIAKALQSTQLHSRVIANLAKVYQIVDRRPQRPTANPQVPMFLEPGDIIITSPLQHPTTRALDLTCVETSATTHRGFSIQECLVRRYQKKMDKYNVSCTAAGMEFRPLIFTSLGIIERRSYAQLCEIFGVRKTEPEGPPRDEGMIERQRLLDDLMMTLGSICAKYMAKSIINHMPAAEMQQQRNTLALPDEGALRAPDAGVLPMVEAVHPAGLHRRASSIGNRQRNNLINNNNNIPENRVDHVRRVEERRGAISGEEEGEGEAI